MALEVVDGYGLAQVSARLAWQIQPDQEGAIVGEVTATLLREQVPKDENLMFWASREPFDSNDPFYEPGLYADRRQ